MLTLIQSVLLYGLVVPVGLTLLWWSCRSYWPDDRLPAGVVLPAVTVCVTYLGVVGPPLIPTRQALSGLVYAVGLIVTYRLAIGLFRSSNPTGATPARVILLLLVLGLFYYPRYPVAENPGWELLTGLNVLVLGYLAWWLSDTVSDRHENLRSTGGGVYLLLVGLFLGLYASFVLGQLILAAGVSLLSILALELLGKRRTAGGESFLFTIAFSVSVLVYAVLFTSVGFPAVILLATGLFAPVAGRVFRPKNNGLLTYGLLMLFLALVVVAAAGYEEFGTEFFRTGESYRPYRR